MATDGPSAPQLEVRRSARRRKTISVHREGDLYVVQAPMRMSHAEVQRHAMELIERLRKREPTRRSDPELLAHALWLRMTFLPDAPEPSSVTWMTQESQWGSCTSADRSIRISQRLAQAPDYVVDAVIVHELAHLLRSDHGTEFQRLIARYPENARADAFLAGMSFAQGVQHGY